MNEFFLVVWYKCNSIGIVFMEIVGEVLEKVIILVGGKGSYFINSKYMVIEKSKFICEGLVGCLNSFVLLFLLVCLVDFSDVF